MNYRTSLYDDDYVQKFDAFVEECCAADVHNNAEMLEKLRRANELFNVDGTDTRNAVIGGLILKMAYYRQMMDGTHFELSTHDDKKE